MFKLLLVSCGISDRFFTVATFLLQNCKCVYIDSHASKVNVKIAFLLLIFMWRTQSMAFLW